MKPLLVAVVFCAAVSVAQGQEPAAAQKEKPREAHTECPMHNAHAHDEPGVSGMNERGAEGMGFSQTATAHHFFLKATGGTIQVEVNDPADTATRDNIRAHLSHIARAFATGDFAIPMFVHDTVPPGVPVMKQLNDKVSYKFEETRSGGRVVIATGDKEALAAIHAFLRFQIDEHRTGDSTVVP